MKKYAGYLFLFAMLAALPIFSHVEEGTGNLLQFYSYYTTNPPVINGCLTDVTTPEGTQGVHRDADADEWKDAYVRHMRMVSTNGLDSIEATWFFMNDSHYLYVGFTGNSNNVGNNQDIDIVFDQGIGGGDHNDALEGGGSGINNGEFRVRCSPDKGATLLKTEYSFNGTSWVQQNNDNEVFVTLGHNFGVSFNQVEWKIPLDTGLTVDDNHSYMNVGPYDELGMNLIYTTTSQGEFHWSGSNNSMVDPSQGNGWIDLRLGVKRDYVTFYATYDAHGIPTVDGNITGGTTPDDGWRGAYMRNLVLTNFAGKTLNATIYCVDDVSAQDLFVGLKIYDDHNDNTDSCEIYQEQDDILTTGRNFLLDNNHENALIANTTAYVASRDRYWSGGASGSWAQDASSANQSAAGAWRTTNYEYEFKVNRSPATDDIIMDNSSLMGFHVRYHDGEDGSDYFWELSPNADKIQIDWNNNIYVATGWPDMQLGAPYFQVIYPEDNSTMEGVTNVRISAQKDPATLDDIDSAVFYRISDPDTRHRITKIGSTNEWSGTWDVTALPNGADTLVFKVYDDALVMDRIVNVTIKNDASSAATPPTVTLTSPAAGSTLGGDSAVITFSRTVAATHSIVSTHVSIDGGAFSSIGAAATSYAWNTTALAEGSHTIQIRVIDDQDESATTNVITYIVKNTPTVSITSPLDSTDQSGRIRVTWDASLISGDPVDSCQISVDAISWCTTVSDSADSINTSVYMDGPHSIQIRAYYFGKIGYSLPIHLHFQNSPSITLNSPRTDSIISGTLVVQFTAAAVAPATVDSTWIAVDGGAWVATATGTTDTLDTQDLTDGDHIIQLKVMDSNNKTGLSQTIKVVVRNAPSITLNSPRADSIISGTLVVQFTAVAVAPATIDSTWIAVDGGAWVATATGTTDTLDTQDLTDGDHTIQLKVSDSNNKTGLSQTIKVVVRNAPSITLNSPRADSIISGTLVVQFTAAAVAPATVDSTWIAVDGGAWVATATGTTDTLDTQNLTEGAHIIQLKVMDINGKTSLSTAIRITIANIPQVVLSHPSAGDLLSGVDTVRFTITPVLPALLDSTWVAIDGGSWQRALSESTFVLVTVDLLDGSHLLQVKARDINGKTGYSSTISFMTKNNPTISFREPLPGQSINGIVTVRFTALPVLPADIDSVLISIDGGAFAATTTESTYVWNTATVSDGEHILKLHVVDTRSKIGESEILLVKVDNTPPVISSANLNYGGNKAVTDNGTLLFSAMVFDQTCAVSPASVCLSVPGLGLDSMALYDNGGNGDTIAGDHIFSRSLLVSGGASGLLAYQIFAADLLGNDTVICDSFFYDNTVPYLSVSISPRAQDGPDSLHGISYFNRIILKGIYGDLHSGVKAAWISITDSIVHGNLLYNSPILLTAADAACNKVIELVEGANIITLSVIDWAGNQTDSVVELTYIPPKVSAPVGTDGGTVTNPNGTIITVPANALFQPTTISITRVSTAALPASENLSIALLSNAYDFLPEGLVFKKEATISLAYTHAELDADMDGVQDIPENNLTIYFLDNDEWVSAGTATIDTGANIVSVAVNHFTLFAIGTVAAAPNKVKSYWSRNPLPANIQSTFVYELPAKSRVGLQVYDLAGDLVRILIPGNTEKPAGAHAIRWDGTNGRNTFAGTGLYIYVFSVDTGNGKTTVKKPIAIVNR
ncbi:MAG: hypothetical protein A2519_15680 [Candidatus Raymondbacteria bacterium RIFOXYD12_FULL_49_13]|uniref:FlgD Ig-like domain-containing protein n=1 Tax=Candidatus Raymondbacteria bacterium RIFOXYD12_FULL_49_13 TaxID=1817890 RepID=A0A1F7F9W4_UNCRA|nr:MAG: hypothetical protein A2519_15680 [Candidatus Raymondbacteria bacterium RIFOXYD12_FULL_49_13]